MRKHLLVTSALLFLYAPTTLAVPPKPEPTPMAAPQFHVDARRREDRPVRLTASDGTGLELTSYEARAVIDGPLAFTEVHLIFKNPQARVLEGRFEITLPEGAALSRLAMKNDKGWQEAEVVELQKARRAYEDFLHRRQDPALLEKQAGNQFQARVFPIPASSEKELILSYSQELTSQQDYMLPLGGLPQVRHLAVQASVWMGPDKAEQKLSYTLNDEAPRGDLTISRSSPVKGLVQGDLALVSLTPQSQEAAEDLQDLLVLVDTSASRGAGYQGQVQRLSRVLTSLSSHRPAARVCIAAFDQEIVPVYTGSLRDCAPAIEKLKQRRPLGATDLGQALRWAGQQKGFKRLLLVTDGVATSGEGKLPAVSGIARIDAMMVGGIRDSQALQDLVYHKQAQSGLVLDGDREPAELSQSLLRRPTSGVKVSVAGAEWVWPEVLDGVEPGQERLVYAKVKNPQPELEVQLQSPSAVAGNGLAARQQIVRVPLTSVNTPLLQRAAVAAQLGSLNQQRLRLKGEDSQEVARRMVALSTKNRVVCDLTGLLVLETEADYARFGIDRQALSDILVVGPKGLELLHRQQAVVVAGRPQPPQVEKMKKAGDGRAPAGAPADKTEAKGGMDEEKEEASRERAAPQEAPRQASTARPSTRSQPSLTAGGAANSPRPALEDGNSPGPMRRQSATVPDRDEGTGKGAPALTGQLLDIDIQIKSGRAAQALEQALRWQAKEPGDVLALVAVGQAYEATGQKGQAARAYGSIIDLYPGRADLRRFAGCRLEGLAQAGEKLAADTFAKALEQRPDHPSSYRMRAYALLRLGKLSEAFETLEQGTRHSFPEGRFAGCSQILREDLALVGAAWAAKEPARRSEIIKRLQEAGASWEDGPSLRFVLSWETDANDVDFHIRDSKGGHAYYSSPGLPSGGRLYADVTTGYGPECFTIRGKPSAAPYNIYIHYYSRGPMGYGMGKVEIVRHDGHGGLRFEERPYIVMNDQAYVDLGTVKVDK